MALVLATVLQADALEISLTQALLVLIAILLIFGVSVFATGFIAKKLAVFDANYGKATWATVLKYVISGVGAGLATSFLAANPVVVLVALNVLAPILIYKFVFDSTIVQAILLWIAVLIAEVISGVLLIFGALSLGAYLDELVGMPF